jgi:hypothetical protein
LITASIADTEKNKILLTTTGTTKGERKIRHSRERGNDGFFLFVRGCRLSAFGDYSTA